MIKKLTHHAVFIISVLVAYLLNGLIMNVLGGIEKIQHDRYLLVGIHMLIIIVIFYPVYQFLTMVGEQVGGAVIKKSQKVVRHPFIGLFIGFMILMSVLYVSYAWVMYKITLVDVVKKLMG